LSVFVYYACAIITKGKVFDQTLPYAFNSVIIL
jgi:hypothetical protein